MGLFDERRHVMAACMFFCVGVVGLVIFSVISSTTIGTEVSVWYSIPLCQASDNPRLFVSQDLTAQEACAAQLDSRETAEYVEVSVPNHLFVPDLAYTVFFYRSNATDIWSDDSYSNVQLPDGGSVSTADAARRLSRLPTAEPDAEGTRRTGRRLLKGGSGGYSGGTSAGYGYSGPSYRSRSGDYSYYGSRPPIVRAGSQTSRDTVVPRLTILTVHSRSSLYGTHTAGGRYSQTTGCNSETGCEYTTTEEYVKDEFTETTFLGPQDPAGHTVLRVQAVVEYSLNKTTLTDGRVLTGAASDPVVSTTEMIGATVQYNDWPKLFVVLASNEAEPAAVVGGVGIFVSLAVFMCCLPWMARSGKLPCCRPEYGYSAATTSSATPPRQVDSSPTPPPSGTFSMVTYPLPPNEGGIQAANRGGSYQNLHIGNNLGSPLAITSLDLSNNDVTTLVGLGTLPALRTLILASNDLRTLGGIEQGASLLALSAQDNNLKGLSGLQHGRLVWLNVAGNDLVTLQGPTAPVLSLRYLCAAGNDIIDLHGLMHFPGMTHLDVSNNEVADVSGLRYCAQLQGCDLSQNSIASAEGLLAALPMLPALQWLDVRGNDLSAIDRQHIRDWWAANRPGHTLLS
mmetsp:Transcript_22557/g.53158  ORF Transcript_22557/g.53158 Transcript_22557/m.53158 type:complete len:625 (-) Transcript_22557:64-1938(-)